LRQFDQSLRRTELGSVELFIYIEHTKLWVHVDAHVTPIYNRCSNG
jgi:hypothetical protein